ncbi:hypothetical protein GCM10017752_64280 [Streptomyces roseoviridis]
MYGPGRFRSIASMSASAVSGILFFALRFARRLLVRTCWHGFLVMYSLATAKLKTLARVSYRLIAVDSA